MSRRRRGDSAETASRADIVAALAGAPGSSRLDLARSLGLGAATVTAQVRRLIELGYVRELPSIVMGSGRPKVPLEVVATAGAIIGVSVHVDSLLVVAIGLDGEIIQRADHAFEPMAEDAVGTIVEACLAMRASLQLPSLAIGIALSGVVDETTGQVGVSVVLGWRRVGLGARVSQATGLPVYVENDVRALASRELFAAEPSALDDFLLVACGWGVGMAVVRNRVVVSGSHGTSTEFGHVSVDPAGPLCRCGNRGCLQAYLGTSELIEELSRSLGGRPTGLAAVVGLRAAQQHLEDVGYLLGRAVGGAATLLGVGDVLLTGESMVVWDVMEQSFWDGLRRTSMTLLTPPTVVVRPWDAVATALGASSTAMTRLLASRV